MAINIQTYNEGALTIPDLSKIEYKGLTFIGNGATDWGTGIQTSLGALLYKTEENASNLAERVKTDVPENIHFENLVEKNTDVAFNRLSSNAVEIGDWLYQQESDGGLSFSKKDSNGQYVKIMEIA